MELEDGTSEFTVDIASNLYHNYGVNSLAHLTCVSSTKEQVHCVVERLKEEGLENILALRGDLPRIEPLWKMQNINMPQSLFMI